MLSKKKSALLFCVHRRYFSRLLSDLLVHSKDVAMIHPDPGWLPIPSSVSSATSPFTVQSGSEPVQSRPKWVQSRPKWVQSGSEPVQSLNWLLKLPLSNLLTNIEHERAMEHGKATRTLTEWA